tara:strand:+ start:1679 stop:2287 length:609 start_codon:yes stop_codon:yes gene_type:complete
MYLPKHQYIKVTKTDLPLLKYSNGSAYTKASAIKTSANEYYDVPAADLLLGIFTNATQLTPPPTTEQPPAPSLFKPTNRDLSLGQVKRHFIKNSATGKIEEITKEVFDSKSKNKQLYEIVGRLDWELSGPANDIIVNGNTYKGAGSINKQRVMTLNETIKGLKEIVTDYTQFVERTPADMIEEEKPKQVKTPFDIPSPSKKL